MLYEKARELSQLSIQQWVSNEFLSFQWFLLLGVLIVVYTIWLRLLDKKRAIQLLLFGSLASVLYHLNVMFLIELLGYVEYTYRLTPISDPPFISGITIIPITLMLVQQYTSSWKSYILWSGIGIAFICFGIFQVYTLVGIMQLHNWNLFYHFLVLFGISIGVRFVFLWIAGTEKRNTSNQP